MNESKVTAEIARLKAMYLRNMEQHEIEGYDWGYAMKRPDSGTYSVYIALIASRLVITGDFMLDHHGVISTPGYDHNWLIGATDPRYLAEKFLPQRWTARRAQLEAEDILSDVRERGMDEVGVTGETIEGLKELEQQGWPPEMDAWQQAVHPYDWEIAPGYGYDVTDMAGLAAIQEKFASLWKAILQPVE